MKKHRLFSAAAIAFLIGGILTVPTPSILGIDSHILSIDVSADTAGSEKINYPEPPCAFVITPDGYSINGEFKSFETSPENRIVFEGYGGSGVSFENTVGASTVGTIYLTFEDDHSFADGYSSPFIINSPVNIDILVKKSSNNQEHISLIQSAEDHSPFLNQSGGTVNITLNIEDGVTFKTQVEDRTDGTPLLYQDVGDSETNFVINGDKVNEDGRIPLYVDGDNKNADLTFENGDFKLTYKGKELERYKDFLDRPSSLEAEPENLYIRVICPCPSPDITVKDTESIYGQYSFDAVIPAYSLTVPHMFFGNVHYKDDKSGREALLYYPDSDGQFDKYAIVQGEEITIVYPDNYSGDDCYGCNGAVALYDSNIGKRTLTFTADKDLVVTKAIRVGFIQYTDDVTWTDVNGDHSGIDYISRGSEVTYKSNRFFRVGKDYSDTFVPAIKQPDGSYSLSLSSEETAAVDEIIAAKQQMLLPGQCFIINTTTEYTDNMLCSDDEILVYGDEYYKLSGNDTIHSFGENDAEGGYEVGPRKYLFELIDPISTAFYTLKTESDNYDTLSFPRTVETDSYRGIGLCITGGKGTEDDPYIFAENIYYLYNGTNSPMAGKTVNDLHVGDIIGEAFNEFVSVEKYTDRGVRLTCGGKFCIRETGSSSYVESVQASDGNWVYDLNNTVADIKILNSPIIESALKGSYLSLNGEISVNLCFDFTDNDLISENSKVEIIVGNGVTTNKREYTYKPSEIKKQYVSLDGRTEIYRVCPVKLAVKEMSTPIVVRFTDADGIEKGLACLSVESISENYTGSNDANVKAAAKAMLDYGKYAQKYFGYNETTITGLDGSAIENVTIEDTYAYDPNKNTLTGVTANTVSLTLEAETTLNVTLSNTSGKTLTATAHYENENTPIDVEVITSGSTVRVRVRNIPAEFLDKNIVIEVSLDGASAGSLVYSPMTYAYYCAKKNDDLGNLMKAFYLYNQAAKGCV